MTYYRWTYWPHFVFTWLRYWLTGDCGHACDHVEPYGWVPEADCPVHDRWPFPWEKQT
jgi:hypothetical protein